MTIRRITGVGVAAAGLALFLAAPAQAAPGDATASGSAGAVSIEKDGETTTVEPVAACDTEGPAEGGVDEVAVPDVVTFTDSETTCAIDDAGELAVASVTGGRFRLDALREYGGPRIRLSSYTARCETTLTGGNSSVRFSGLSGVDVPSRIPSNHTVTISGAAGTPPIATVTFNEAVVPSPADGSMTVHLMHVRLFPQGGPASGDVYVGTVHCAPVD